jgi:manganese transport protein
MTDLSRGSLSERTVSAACEVLAGQRRGLRSFLPFLGPAVIASIGYMDPGNLATNIESGASFGYTLLWVVLSANLIAMLFQALAAKLGIVTGRSLAEQSREYFPRFVVYGMWMCSEIAAMATDVAEFLGAAIAITLLFRLPLMVSMALSGIATYAILSVQGSGFRPMEILMGVCVVTIGACYLIELIVVPPDWMALGYHLVVPQLQGGRSLTLAVGIVGQR